MSSAQEEPRNPEQERRIAALLTDGTAAPAPDPIFAAIDKAQALHAVQQAAYAICGELPDADPAWDPEREAYTAWFAHIDDVLLKTVPTTTAGCIALAQFTVDFCADQGIPLSQAPGEADEDNIEPLRLIARSAAARELRVPDRVEDGPGDVDADVDLIALAHAAILEETVACLRCNFSSDPGEGEPEPDFFSSSYRLLEQVTGMRPTSPAGLAAKAMVLLTHTPDVHQLESDSRVVALAFQMAKDAICLVERGTASTGAQA